MQYIYIYLFEKDYYLHYEIKEANKYGVKREKGRCIFCKLVERIEALCKATKVESIRLKRRNSRGNK